MSVWRAASPGDDAAIVAMCLALNAEDAMNVAGQLASYTDNTTMAYIPANPGPRLVVAEQVHRTLDTLRREPLRGHPSSWKLMGKLLAMRCSSLFGRMRSAESCVPLTKSLSIRRTATLGMAVHCLKHFRVETDLGPEKLWRLLLK